MRTAVLFLVFNRPHTTLQVFKAIRQARPPRLYVAADGPRADRPGESKLCEEVRRMATAVDWSCEVKTLFRDRNLGCGRAVSEGITWFFDQEEEGIILEDDVLPVKSFFPYCEALLDRYRHEPRVSMISGCNHVSKHYHCDNSYFFSYYGHIWGWCTWRRAWSHYDVTLSSWPEWDKAGKLAEISHGSKIFVHYWRDIFNRIHQGSIDTWDGQWLFCQWRLGLFAILPCENLVQNIGFGSGATHTRGTPPKYVKESVNGELTFPLLHPPDVRREIKADSIITSRVFGINWINAVLTAIRRLPGTKLLVRGLKLLRHY